jgi:prepilin peptidase CpaA
MALVGSHVVLIAFFVTTVAAIVAAVIDFRRFRVPNVLTFPLCISGWIFHTAVNGLTGLQYSAGGIIVGVLILLIFYVLGVMGAGDVKLLAAIGAWIGGTNTLYVFCVAGVVTGIHSLVVLTWQRRLREVPAIFQVALIQVITLGRHIAGSDAASLTAAIQRPDRHRYVMPFAVMIAIGVVVVALKSWE